jgi:hypothetical protein
MVYLLDRYDHYQHLLLHVLSFVNNDIPSVREAALDCIQRCGLQFECKHPKDIIEQPQVGINYRSGLP